MGSFSWMRADKATKRSNFIYGDPYKILIPKEFGGGFIKDTFGEFGKVFYGKENEKKPRIEPLTRQKIPINWEATHHANAARALGNHQTKHRWKPGKDGI